MILGIVGHSADKFTPATEKLCRAAIRGAIKHYKPTKVVSGKCPLGGVDIYAIEEAKKLGVETLEFPPVIEKWEGTKDQPGYHQRNMQIAEASDVVISFVLSEFPPNFKGRKFAFCYHHRDEQEWHDKHPHIKSGGCWTAKYARSIGKVGKTIILK
jgi:hypothetical protein